MSADHSDHRALIADAERSALVYESNGMRNAADTIRRLVAALSAEPVVEPTREASTTQHAYGSLVEQVHRVITTEQGIEPWELAALIVAFVAKAAPTGPTEAQVAPTTAQIMAAAQALWSIEGSEDWDDIDGDIQDHYRNDARIALNAALEVTPQSSDTPGTYNDPPPSTPDV